MIVKKCEKCKGEKVLEEINEVEVEIEKGWKEGEEIRFEGESDEGPDFEAGDVVVRIR